MKSYGGADIYIRVSFTWAPDGGEWSGSRPGRFAPAEWANGPHWVEGWVGPKAVLDAVKKGNNLPLSEIEPRPSNP
jgi:hypothetical protein